MLVESLGEAEIGDLALSIRGVIGHQQVLRLEVSMGDALLMQIPAREQEHATPVCGGDALESNVGGRLAHFIALRSLAVVSTASCSVKWPLSTMRSKSSPPFMISITRNMHSFVSKAS